MCKFKNSFKFGKRGGGIRIILKLSNGEVLFLKCKNSLKWKKMIGFTIKIKNKNQKQIGIHIYFLKTVVPNECEGF